MTQTVSTTVSTFIAIKNTGNLLKNCDQKRLRFDASAWVTGASLMAIFRNAQALVPKQE